MSGRQVARHVTLSNPHAAILYMSGYTDEIITRHRILGEEALFLEKPFTPSALGGAVRQALDQRTRYS
jgi:FixJ family two-component response regulator